MDQERQRPSARKGSHMASSSQRTRSSARSPRSDNRAQGSRRSGRSSQQRAVQRGTQRSGGRQAAAAQRRAPQRRTSIVGPLIVGVLVLALVGVGGFLLYQHLTSFDVTVNGQTARARKGQTIAKFLDEGLVTPIPGDLLAIDGSLLQEGKGYRCSATIDGQPANEDTEVHANAVIEIGNGTNKEEDVTTQDEPIPFSFNEGDTSTGAYWTGSIHLLSDGVDGVKRVTTGTLSGKTKEEVIQQPIDAGYRIYTARPMDRAIALTFDDGPWPETTNQILDILEQYGAKATFFTIGNQIGDYADAVRRADAMGCQVCTHTWDHAAGSGQGVNIGYMSASEQIDEVTRGYAAIADVLGREPARIMRAPGGNFGGDTITNLWDYVDAEIGWDVDTEDWRRPGVDSIVSMILSVQPGQVILMHDGGGDRSQTVEALRQALPVLAEQGYSFVTIDELLAYGIPA